ncbi:hypothetical protein [Novosphingobium malaysiense]|uniref:Uncharacterized protein n=1 Tax=Novosphingobium malaysiense TaxID=1348853 RepID=A0A0B1ZPL4_9SPHN|nr:hypothetical protein [Novosphingobium malaysiense]KHK91234.1 hypothetical protein LK12_10090 [Novosphingobium malaysiense]
MLAAACALPSAAAFTIAFTVSAPLPAQKAEAKDAVSMTNATLHRELSQAARLNAEDTSAASLQAVSATETGTVEQDAGIPALVR